MKKLFLILTSIIFLFFLNIGVQSASAITCGDCEKCTAQNCTSYTCTDWANVCVKEDKVCAEYGDYCGGWETVCSGSWEYVCQGYGDYCGGWELQCTEMANVCIEYGDYCAGWETLCTGSWENVCQRWSNVCTNYASVCDGYTSVCDGYVPVCTNWTFLFGIPICLNWTTVCTSYHDECTGWHSECTNWEKQCTGGYKRECNGMEYTQCTGGWTYGCIGGYEDRCIGVWANVCVGGWIWDCVEGYEYQCVGILSDQCTGGWTYGCVSWNTTCTEWENQCVNTECAEFTCDSCASYCSGSDSDCGCTSCVDCNAQDACVGKDYHDYSCSGNSCAVNIIADDSRCKGCENAGDCTESYVGQCVTGSSKIGSIECNNNTCSYNEVTAINGATTLHNGGLYQISSCDGQYHLVRHNGQACETHCEGNELYIPGIWESGVSEGCNWNVSSCGPCGCSASGCVASGPGPCPDFCENSNLFINGIECGGKCVWGEPLHCDHGCASPDCAYAPGGCAPSCTGYTCSNAECSGCPFCSVSCPDVCFGEIFETGGYVSNNEDSYMTCFYANQEWCGDGCCIGPGDPPPPPSCYWGQKSCGWGGGGCAPNEMGYQCKGPSGCTEEECSKGDTYCEVDLINCPGVGDFNTNPTAVINYFPSDTIYTNETNFTLKGNGSYDDDGFIAKYSWSIPSLGRTKDSVNISDTDFFLGNPAKGTHPVTLEVTDNENGKNTATGSFTVIQALTADFEWEPKKPLRNEEVDFTDLSEGDNIVSWSWTFEDGDVPAGQENKQDPENIKFTSDGSKKVRLTITDILGNTAFDEDFVNVKIPMPKWKETHPKTENIFDDPFLIFASLLEYLEG